MSQFEIEPVYTITFEIPCPEEVRRRRFLDSGLVLDHHLHVTFDATTIKYAAANKEGYELLAAFFDYQLSQPGIKVVRHIRCGHVLDDGCEQATSPETIREDLFLKFVKAYLYSAVIDFIERNPLYRSNYQDESLTKLLRFALEHDLRPTEEFEPLDGSKGKISIWAQEILNKHCTEKSKADVRKKEACEDASRFAREILDAAARL